MVIDLLLAICSVVGEIPREGGAVSGVTSGASALAGACAASGSSPEHVYTWTAPRSGTVNVETCNATSTLDSVVYVREDDCNGAEVACNDDVSGCPNADTTYRGSRLSFIAEAGRAYAIIVDGYNGRTGSYRLTLSSPPAPTCAIPPIFGQWDEIPLCSDNGDVSPCRFDCSPARQQIECGCTEWFHWMPVSTAEWYEIERRHGAIVEGPWSTAPFNKPAGADDDGTPTPAVIVTLWHPAWDGSPIVEGELYSYQVRACRRDPAAGDLCSAWAAPVDYVAAPYRVLP